jgi:hypothetical protein
MNYKVLLAVNYLAAGDYGVFTHPLAMERNL